MEKIFEELKERVGNQHRAPNGTPTAQNATDLTVAQRLERLKLFATLQC